MTRNFEQLFRKATVFLTNLQHLYNALNVKCTNISVSFKGEIHKHASLVNDRARAAAIYPPKLVATILSGLKSQLHADSCWELQSLDDSRDLHGQAATAALSGDLHDEPEFLSENNGVWGNFSMFPDAPLLSRQFLTNIPAKMYMMALKRRRLPRPNQNSQEIRTQILCSMVSKSKDLSLRVQIHTEKLPNSKHMFLVRMFLLAEVMRYHVGSSVILLSSRFIIPHPAS